MGLSEKAKGKQRAVEPANEPEAKALSKDLTIRFTEGIPDLMLAVAEKDTVRDVKTNIRASRPQLEKRRLKLILSGQLLTDSALLYTRIVVLEERQRRAASGGQPNVVSLEPSPAASTWLHCSVGPPIADEEEAEEESKIQTAQLKPLRGFDRLAAAGFSAQDIANFRLQFHAHSAVDYLDQEFEDDEEFDEHARALEERWIESMDGGTASQSANASSAMLNGIGIGFFFPLIPFFYFRPPKPAVFWDNGVEHEVMGSSIFSRRMQIGVILGFIVNLIFGTWIYLLTAP
ncbi:hypothetical protein SCP_0503090 [Sparassis crispa]|uniref:Ubiquitin-like domain-containing protein n=1 Tax=Sparassis crispa TaxID=139825 RepID=A0A401GM13_9APHY|nr:hypothetical protein SCP_0503090 [Sparassis crispa]GBE83261.1 hypothetical protein SCP_0503090 [Sparassis crispa]